MICFRNRGCWLIFIELESIKFDVLSEYIGLNSDIVNIIPESEGFFSDIVDIISVLIELNSIAAEIIF